MIFDIIEVCEKQNIGGFLVTKDIRKALVSVLNNIQVGSDFIS